MPVRGATAARVQSIALMSEGAGITGETSQPDPSSIGSSPCGGRSLRAKNSLGKSNEREIHFFSLQSGGVVEGEQIAMT
jgi:hypothetical protein